MGALDTGPYGGIPCMKQVELIVQRQGEASRRFRLEPGELSIGRAEDNALVLPDVEVSRRHAKIIVADETVVIEDLGSGNGTYFQGTSIDRMIVDDGAEVVIAPYTLQFIIPNEITEQITDPGTDADIEELEAAEGNADAVAARLVTLQGQGLDDFYELPATGATMGRAEQREITLPDPAASRNHAQLLNASGSWWVRDNGSVNGTFVNGRRIRETPLSPGDRLRIGATEFRFEFIEEDDVNATSTMPFVSSMFADETAGYPAPPVPEGPTPAFPQSPPPMQAAAPVADFEMSIDPDAVSAGRRLDTRQSASAEGTWLSRNIRKLTGGILAATLLLVVGRGMFGGDDVPETTTPTAAPTATTSLPAPTTTLATTTGNAGGAQGVQGLLEEGTKLFGQREYLEAMRRFDEVQTLTPGEPTSRKLSFYSCEFLIIDALRSDVVRRSTSASEQQAAYDDAVAQSEDALKGRVRMTALREAQSAVSAALNFFPEDATLLEYETKLKRKIGAIIQAGQDRSAKAFEDEIGAIFSSAEAKANSDRIAAIKEFERVLQADSDRQTEYYVRAQDRIRALKARLDEMVRDAYTQGLSAARSGQHLKARTLFRQVQQTNPFHRASAGKLLDTQKKLDELAAESFDQAKVYEKLNKLELAIKNYQKAIDYSKNSQADLAQKARAKINKLSGLQ